MTANPTLLSMPLAQNGQKNVIPETQVTAGDGLFSQSTGFPAETSLPLAAGGKAPSREDFNGLANLLGGVAFMAQKGFTFNYDATQDYYPGCIVIDSADGLRYECISDMAAGTIAPHDDTANTYWTIFKSGLDADEIPAINKRDVVTTSGTYTAPVTGWYQITVKGGGGGGAGGQIKSGNMHMSGGGGGEGGTTIAFEYLSANDTATVVIGAGGTGGAGTGAAGTNGGDSSVTVNSNTYTGGGGVGGGTDDIAGAGGTGTIAGASGETGQYAYSAINTSFCGGTGGGMGGGAGSRSNPSANGTKGGGGAGGCGYYNGGYDGGAGGDGYVWFEWFDTSLNP